MCLQISIQILSLHFTILILLISVLCEDNTKSNSYINRILCRNFIEGPHSSLYVPIEDNLHQYSCQYLLGNGNDLDPVRNSITMLGQGHRITSILPSSARFSQSPFQGRYLRGTEIKKSFIIQWGFGPEPQSTALLLDDLDYLAGSVILWSIGEIFSKSLVYYFNYTKGCTKCSC